MKQTLIGYYWKIIIFELDQKERMIEALEGVNNETVNKMFMELFLKILRDCR